MKIRLAFTFSIERNSPAAEAEAPYVEDKGIAVTELSATPPIGFHIQPTNNQDPFEAGEDRR